MNETDHDKLQKLFSDVAPSLESKKFIPYKTVNGADYLPRQSRGEFDDGRYLRSLEQRITEKEIDDKGNAYSDGGIQTADEEKSNPLVLA